MLHKLLDAAALANQVGNFDRMNQDRIHITLAVQQWLGDEVEKIFVECAVGIAVDRERDLRADKRLAGGIDLVEDLNVALALQFG